MSIDAPAITAVVSPSPSLATPPPAPSRKSLRVVVKEVELEKLHKIDVQNNSFQAVIWVPFCIEDGALDPDISAKGAIFPIGADGKPTFKPSAEWYMQQVDFRNALTWKWVDSKVLRRGNDLIMAVRVEGTFVEVYELDDYPFDCQGLSITLNFNCRTNGPMPIDISVAPNAKVTMTAIALCPPIKEWTVDPGLWVRPHLVGTGDRTFPGISFTAKVSRNPFYHLIYLASPFGIFSFLCVLTGATRKITDLPHRAQLTLMLVLTVSTYRIAIGNKLPPITYLTMLDYYSIANVIIILLVTMESRVQILLTEQGLINSTPGETHTGNLDSLCIIGFVVAWLVTHVWFLRIVRLRARERLLKDDNLLDFNNLYMDEAYEKAKERGHVRKDIFLGKEPSLGLAGLDHNALSDSSCRALI